MCGREEESSIMLLAPHQLPRCSSCSLALHDRLSLRSLHPFIDGFHPPLIFMSTSTKFSTIARLTTPSHGPVPYPRAPPDRSSSLLWCPCTAKRERRLENKRTGGMKRCPSYAIAQKRSRGPSYARSELHICPKIGVGVPYGGGGPSCQRNKSEAAQPKKLGRGRGETVGGHGT